MIGQQWALPVPLTLLPTGVWCRDTRLPRKPKRTCAYISAFFSVASWTYPSSSAGGFESPFPIQVIWGWHLCTPGSTLSLCFLAYWRDPKPTPYK